MIFVGVDWAEAHHDVFVQDEAGKRLAGGRLPEGVEGIARFHEMVGHHAEEPDQVSNRDRDRPGSVRRSSRGRRLPGVHGEPHVDLPLSGPALDFGPPAALRGPDALVQDNETKGSLHCVSWASGSDVRGPGKTVTA